MCRYDAVDDNITWKQHFKNLSENLRKLRVNQSQKLFVINWTSNKDSIRKKNSTQNKEKIKTVATILILYKNTKVKVAHRIETQTISTL